MVVLKDVDELLATPLPCAAQGGGEQKGECGAAVRAVHECFCHVDRGGACCAYLAHGADRGAAPPVGGASYFNSGLVVLRPGHDATPQALCDHANAQLGKTQRLSAVELHDSLPRSEIGKVLKRDLRAPYWAKATA